MLLNDKKSKRRLQKACAHHTTDDTTLEKVYTSLPYVYSLYPHVGVDVFY